MKRHIIAKSAGLAALALLLLGTFVATANIATANTTDIAETTAIRFQSIAIELPEIKVDSMPALRLSSYENLEKILVEKTEFRKDIRPLVHQLKSKWIALTDELAKQSPKEMTTARLQDEISALGTRLAEMRLEHLFALEEIKADAVD